MWQEVAVLAHCRSENITEYYASVLRPGSSELFIVMELMDASVADLVWPLPCKETPPGTRSQDKPCMQLLEPHPRVRARGVQPDNPVSCACGR